MQKPTVIDLFCDCGGMSWGMQQSGFNVIAGIDNDEQVLKTFALNHPESLTIHADLANFSPDELMLQLGMQSGELDCVIGGPHAKVFPKMFLLHTAS